MTTGTPLARAFVRLEVASGQATESIVSAVRAGGQKGQVEAESQGKQIGDRLKRGLEFGAGFYGGEALFRGVTQGLKTVIESADQLKETTERVDRVFGESSGSVLKFGQDAAKSYGLSAVAADQMSVKLGALLTNLKLPQEEAAKMSVQLIKLAADLAAFNHTDPASAEQALQSALAGRTQGLKQYGIVVDAVSVQQQALKDGLIHTVTDALDPAAKAQATYEVIMQRSTVQQGAFARGSGSLAEQTQILKAQITDAGAKIGGYLVPALADGAKGLQKLGQLASDNKGYTLELIGAFAGYKLIPPLISGIGDAYLAMAAKVDTARTAILSLGGASGFAGGLAIAGSWGLAIAAAGSALNTLFHGAAQARTAVDALTAGLDTNNMAALKQAITDLTTQYDKLREVKNFKLGADGANQLDQEDALAKKIKDLTTRLHELQSGQSGAAGAQRDATKATADQAQKASDAAQKVNDLVTAIQSLAGENQSLLGGQLAVNKAILTLGDNLDKGSRSLDRNTLAGITNLGAINDAAGAIERYAEEQVRAKVPADKVSAAVFFQSQALEKAAVKAGFNKDEIDKLLQSLLKMPPAIEQIPTQRTITITAVDNATSLLDQVKNTIAGLGGTISVQGLGNLSKLTDPRLQADGGFIAGPGGPRDDQIPAYLSNGEFVVNAAATARNRDLLEAINGQRFADGGIVGKFVDLYGTWLHPTVDSTKSSQAVLNVVRPMIDAMRSGASGGATSSGGNVELGRTLAASLYGWAGAEFDALNKLFTRESGWNANAVNPSSGAYGIPQSLGHGHPFNLGDAQAQILWGLDYIKGRYGDPLAAWAHESQVGWYHQGGTVPGRGNQLAVLEGGEHVSTAADMGQVVTLLGKLIKAVDRNAVVTGSSVADALNATARTGRLDGRTRTMR